MTMNKNMKRWIKILSKIERTLINKEVWGIADPKIKVEKEDVTGKGDTKKVLLNLLLSQANNSQSKIVPNSHNLSK